MKPLFQIGVIGALLILLATLASAQVPQMINYQGKLATNTGAPVNDTLQMIFTIYADQAGTTPLWTETQPAVEILKGVFNVLLGSVDSIPYSVFDGSIRYLGVKVGEDPEITPRKPMVSVGYAFHSGTADTSYFSMPDADWTISGDNIYHLNGKVGIGTTSPATLLHLYKDSTGTGAMDGIIIDQDGTGDAGLSLRLPGFEQFVIGIDNSDGYKFKISDGADFGSDRVVIDANGYVGIGTTNPTAELDVSGDLNVTGTINECRSQFVRVNTTNSGEYIFDDAWYNNNRPDITTTGTAGQIYIDSHGGVQLNILIKEDGLVVIKTSGLTYTYTASDGKLLEIYVWPYTFIYQWFVHFTGAREGDYIAGLVKGGRD